MRVVVAGGGVVGLWTAAELAAAGAEVVVADHGPQAGAAGPASAGWVVPVLSAPLSGPGVLLRSLVSLARGRASFAVRPALSPGLPRWALGFLRSGTARAHRAGLRALLELGLSAVPGFEALCRAHPFELHRTGLLIAARTRRGVEEAQTLVEEARAAGYPGAAKTFDGPQARALEPALGERVAGAVHAGEDLHVRPELMLDALARAAHERGAEIRRGAPVLGVERTGHGRWRVVTALETIEADRVVIAAGIWSVSLLAGLGVRVPLLPAGGYSLTSAGSGTPPRHALKLIEDNVAITPFHGGVRVAGMFELAAGPRPPVERRMGHVLRMALPYLRDWRPSAARVTYGLRPATPDSLPLIGPVPGHDGVYAATGHGTLGLTLAPGTAAHLAPLVLAGRPARVLEPFSLTRWAARRA
ncbi:NAD(P)/FAD-dependent oxidoreductase [Nonomuraea turcica]|uniref:NAD(P)/FAD-dependent oxidoreductase n=1 Tax=Nonomuraea sp. G32 TaxID=3067274 RepID=UPI00273B4109|nr:FAD-dependent oxidoreductase [Nonomuraea sp. G32]MDP4511190.1 FAD-dependent oxidoreductase [Nonomuraea sp. G32]